MHPSLPLAHSAPGLSTNPPACSAASSQGSPIIFPDFLRVSPSSAFLEGLPLCCRSYLPVCFLLAKPLVLIHLHKHRGPPDPREWWPLLGWKGAPPANRPAALPIASVISRCLSLLIFKVRIITSHTSQGCCKDHMSSCHDIHVMIYTMCDQ